MRLYNLCMMEANPASNDLHDHTAIDVDAFVNVNVASS